MAVIVGGAGPGLGQAVSHRIAARGASVVDLNADAAREVAKVIAGTYGVPVSAVRAMAEEVESAVGPVDVLVNSMGGQGSGRFTAQDEADFERIVSVNLDAMVNTTRTIAEKMIQRKSGSIVNVSSIGSVIPRTRAVLYSATKAAVNALTRGLAWELSPHNVRINAVMPGIMTSSRLVSVLEDSPAGALYPRSLRLAMTQAAIGRPTNPAEVADVITFLASEAASCMHGAVRDVSGGNS